MGRFALVLVFVVAATAIDIASRNTVDTRGRMLEAAAMKAFLWTKYPAQMTNIQKHVQLQPLRLRNPPNLRNPVNSEQCFNTFARISLCPNLAEKHPQQAGLLMCTKQDMAGDSQFAAIYMLLRQFGGGTEPWSASFNPSSPNRADILFADAVFYLLQLARTGLEESPDPTVTVLSGSFKPDVPQTRLQKARNFLSNKLAGLIGSDALKKEVEPMVVIVDGQAAATTTATADWFTPTWGDTVAHKGGPKKPVSFALKIGDLVVGTGQTAVDKTKHTVEVDMQKDGKPMGTLVVSFVNSGRPPKFIRNYIDEFWPPAEVKEAEPVPEKTLVERVSGRLKKWKDWIGSKFGAASILDGQKGPIFNSTRFREIVDAIATNPKVLFFDCHKVAFALKSLKVQLAVSSERRRANAESKVKLVQFISKAIKAGAGAIPQFGNVASAITGMVGEMIENKFADANNADERMMCSANALTDLLLPFVYPITVDPEDPVNLQPSVGLPRTYASGKQCDTQVKYLFRFIYGMLEDAIKVSGPSPLGTSLQICLPEDASGTLAMKTLLGFLKTFTNFPDNVSPELTKAGSYMDRKDASTTPVLNALKDNALVKNKTALLKNSVSALIKKKLK